MPDENEHSELYEQGMRTRREVFGDEYVENMLKSPEPFMEPYQELVTELCWGNIWNRPGLSRRDRSMINLAMLSALNHPEEVGLHVRGALRNGVTPLEIQEVLLQVLLYCGAPAARASFKVAADILKEAIPPSA